MIIILIFYLIFNATNILSEGLQEKSIGSSIIYGCKDYMDLTFLSAEHDVNGDGRKDIIALSYGISNYPKYSVQFWILYNPLFRFPEEIYMCDPPFPYTEIYGFGTASEETPYAIGDFNGDGFSDIAIGNTYSSDGRYYVTYIIYSKSNLPEKIYLPDPPPQHIVKISKIFKKISEHYYFGLGRFTLSSDLNKDGYDDLIITESSYDPKKKKHIENIYILYGSPFGIADTDATYLEPIKLVVDEFDGLWESFKIEDVDGDQKKDLILFLPWNGFSNDRKNAGKILIIYDDFQNLSEIDTENPPENSTIIYGEMGDFMYMFSNLYIEDLNENGFKDLILVNGHSICGEQWSKIMIFYGTPSGFPKIIDLFYSDPDVKICESDEKHSISPLWTFIKDFNGDGYKDLIISGSIPYGVPGKLWIVLGPLSNLPEEMDLENLPENIKVYEYEWQTYDEETMSGSSGLGPKIEDLNRDGLNDLVYSSNIICETRYFAGLEIFVCYGEIWILYGSTYKFN